MLLNSYVYSNPQETTLLNLNNFGIQNNERRLPIYFNEPYSHGVTIIDGASIGGPKILTSIWFREESFQGSPVTKDNLRLELIKCSTAIMPSEIRNDLSSSDPSWLISNRQVVKDNFSWTVPNGINWIEIRFDNSYYWDGIRHLLVNFIDNSNNVISGTGSNPRTITRDDNQNRGAYWLGNSSSDSNPTSFMTLRDKRPEIRLNHIV